MNTSSQDSEQYDPPEEGTIQNMQPGWQYIKYNFEMQHSKEQFTHLKKEWQ